MSYFNRIPFVTYDFTLDTEDRDVIFTFSDITVRVAKYTDVLTEDILVDEYFVQDEDTPESLSLSLYGTTDYHWTICYLNNITDYAEQWPKSDFDLLDYIKAIYPGTVPDPRVNLAIKGHIQNVMESNVEVSYFIVDTNYYLNELTPLVDELAELANLQELISTGNWMYGYGLLEDLEYKIESIVLASDKLDKFKLDRKVLDPTVRVDGKFDDPTNGAPTSINGPHDTRIPTGTYYIKTPTEEYNDIRYYRSADSGVIGTKNAIEFFEYIDPTNLQTTLVSSGDVAQAITHFDYEVELNETKRIVQVLAPEFVELFVSQYMEQLKR